MGLDARLVSFAPVYLFCFVSIFLLQENQVMIILLRPEKKMR